MRILLVADWPRVEGGTERYVEWVRGGLQARGDEVRLLTSSAGSAAGGTAEYIAPGSERMAAQAFLQVASPLAAVSVRDALRDFAPDGVLVTTFLTHLSPAILVPLRGVPTVVLVGDYRPVCPVATKLLPDGSLCVDPAGLVCWRNGCVSLPHWLRDRPRYALLRRGLRSVDRVLACSAWMRERLAEGGIESETIVLPVASPAESFARSPDPHPRFACIARLRWEKGVDLLIRAFAAVVPDWPEASLSVLGDGPERIALERLAHDLGVGSSVTFAGWVEADGVEAELARAWALVAPSRWAEPLGLSAVEALVRGVPVVAPAAGGFEETIESGATGLLFSRGNVDQLARCLTAIARGDALPSRSVSAEAVARARERHDLGRHLDTLETLFAAIRATER